MKSELQSEYDVVFCGTGPVESLVAGCLSGLGLKTLHTDKEPEYGGCRATRDLTRFLEWLQGHGELLVDRISSTVSGARPPTIWVDAIPLVFFARDQIFDILVRTGSASHISLELVDGLYFRGSHSWRSIPTSKSFIFRDKALTLRQKREVMNFIVYFFPDQDYGDRSGSDIGAKVSAFSERPFSSFLNSLNLSPELCGAFEYFVAGASAPLLTKDAVPRVRSFCSSIGRYGPTPFLALRYGASDLPQLFCRRSAVSGGIYALGLNPAPVPGGDGLLELDVPGVGTIHTRHFLTTPDQHFLADGPRRPIAFREVVLLAAPLLPEDRAVGVIAPAVMGNTSPVYVVQFDSSLAVCSAGQWLVHVSAMCDIRAVVDELIMDVPQESVLLRAAFALTEAVGEVTDPRITVIPSPSLEDLVMGSDYFVEKAIEIVKKLAPDAQFYPEPTDVEIVEADPPPPQVDVHADRGA
jgi:RAB protein geranylgeranyltransferase component A